MTADTVIDGEDRVSGWNRFAYVAGNPIRNSDPSGNRATEEGGLVYTGFDVGVQPEGKTAYKATESGSADGHHTKRVFNIIYQATLDGLANRGIKDAVTGKKINAGKYQAGHYYINVTNRSGNREILDVTNLQVPSSTMKLNKGGACTAGGCTVRELLETNNVWTLSKNVTAKRTPWLTTSQINSIIENTTGQEQQKWINYLTEDPETSNRDDDAVTWSEYVVNSVRKKTIAKQLLMLGDSNRMKAAGTFSSIVDTYKTISGREAKTIFRVHNSYRAKQGFVWKKQILNH